MEEQKEISPTFAGAARELTILNADVSGREPTVREKTAAAALIGQSPEP